MGKDKTSADQDISISDFIEILGIHKNTYFTHMDIKDDSITISNYAHKVCSVYFNKELMDLYDKLKPYQNLFDIYMSFRRIVIKKKR